MRLADALDVAPAFLIEGTADDVANERLSDKELLKQFQLAEELPEEDKNTIIRVISSFIRNHRIDQAMAQR